MLIKSFPAGPWQTNCYVVAPSRNSECFIVDPGYQSADAIASIVQAENLKPIAVLVTHGHLDHMWSLFPAARGYDIPAVVHAQDRHLLSDPLSGISNETILMLRDTLNESEPFVEPDEIVEISDNTSLDVAGLTLKITHAPGHTAGSVLFEIDDDEPTVFTGDVLFAGAIGRTDLPGGSSQAMTETLRNHILPISDSATILPGHGPRTTMAVERVTNQYLLRVAQGLNAV